MVPGRPLFRTPLCLAPFTVAEKVIISFGFKRIALYIITTPTTLNHHLPPIPTRVSLTGEILRTPLTVAVLISAEMLIVLFNFVLLPLHAVAAPSARNYHRPALPPVAIFARKLLGTPFGVTVLIATKVVVVLFGAPL